ncbi:MAG TPA: GNAT family N-acetyltransferase [bacterium]|nr:GNAT family N-acetyltransferase [bacterium]
MSDVMVKAARPADEPAVLALVQAEMRAQEDVDSRFRLRPDGIPRYAAYLQKRLREIDSTVFVAMIDGETVGVAVGSIRIQEAFFEPRRFGYVSDLVVHPSWRRHGVGRALWDRVALWFRGLGVDVVRLHVAARSREAQSFWESVGADPFLTESWIDLPAVAPGDGSGETKEAVPAVGPPGGARKGGEG